MKRITVQRNKKGVMEIETEGGLVFEEAITLLINGIASVANSFVRAAPAEAREQLRGQVYDSLNLAFARLLDAFMPPTDAQFDDLVLKIAQKEAVALMKQSVDEKRPYEEIYKEKYGRLS